MATSCSEWESCRTQTHDSLISILICHTCEVMDYPGKGELLTNTDLDIFVNNI